ncbi:MAG: ATP-binding cassette domain-containing protein, partial [Acidimicrobiales bacterium]
MALLEARGLTVSYGGLYANDDIDLDCDAGKLVGLIGPNGAGKTTFIDAITGFTPITDGRVTFDGEDLAGKRPDARAQMGLVRTFQSLELFEDLTVRDNLLVAAERPRWYSFVADVVWPGRDKGAMREQVDVALESMHLSDLADKHPSD